MEFTAKVQQQRIKTPDQRLRVFVSSTLQELAEERVAVRRAIQRLRLTPVMFELGARPHAPKDLYRAYLEQSHIFVGIYYQSYGWVAPNETISGLEDEFRLSGGLPRLIYVKRPAPQIQEGLKTMLAQIHNDSYRHFSTAEELEEFVTNDLATLLSERFETAPLEKENIQQQVSYQLPIPPNQLIGRSQEIEMVKEWFRSGEKRLVTLLGSGGVGKSRLSIAIGEELKDVFPDGIYFVTFDKISDPALMAGMIADKFGLTGSSNIFESLKFFLAEKKLLLIFDNLEQLIPGAGLFISNLLQAALQIRVLATSRIPLEITGEQEFHIHPFDIPGQSCAVETALQSHAVQLFAERVKSIKPGFAVNSSNVEDVLAICRRLDGLPLALELAAARMRIFTPRQLAQKLNSSLDLLKDGPRDLPDRQRTMRNVVAWSYNLLNDRQKEVFHMLSAFSGGVSYDAAEKVCKDEEGDLMEVLLSLVAQNLLRLREEESSEIRFAMFDSIREFGCEKLHESGKQKEVQINHALFYLDWVANSYKQLEKDPMHTVQLVQEESGNIRLAFDALLRFREDERLPRGAAAMLGIGMVSFWDQFGINAEAFQWLIKAVDTDTSMPLPIKTKALYRMAMLSAMHGQFDAGEQYAREALSLAQQAGDVFLIANAQRSLGKVLTEENKYEEAYFLINESLKTYRQLGDKTYIARSLQALGSLYFRQGRVVPAREAYMEDLKLNLEEGNKLAVPGTYISIGTVLEKEGRYDEAKKYYLDGIEQQKKVGDTRMLSRAIHNLANIHYHHGEFAEAKKLYQESLVVKEKLSDKPGIATSLGNLGWVAFSEGNFDEAKSYHERSIALKRKMGYLRGIAISLDGLALVMLYQGDYKQAYYVLHEAIGIAKQSDDKTVVAGSLEVWSLLMEKQKHYESSAVMLGAADGLRKACNAPAFTNDKKRNEDLEARLRKNFGEKEFEKAFKAGSELAYEDAIAYAMQSKL